MATVPTRAARRLKQAVLGPLYGAVIGVRTSEPYVALTFDDGPHPRWTPAVLDVLERHGASATFFCVGEAALRHGDVVAAALEAGHAIGSHTLTHPSLTRLPRADVEREVAAGHAALGGQAAPLFRPPYGHHDLTVARVARSLGLKTVLWSAHALDWRRLEPGELAGRLSRAIRPGSIVLLHDALFTSGPEEEPDRTALLGALDLVLGSDAGAHRFVTLPRLLELGRPVKAMVERRGDDAWVASQARPEAPRPAQGGARS